MSDNSLSIVRAAQIDPQPDRPPWLIQQLWSSQAVGIIGGSPKLGKSWLGLDMALSVASATPCLNHFPVDQPGPTLIYMAEDALQQVRSRIDSVCHSRNYPIESLDLHVIAANSLRLDLPKDQDGLIQALEIIRPRLLLLDPLVRIHRLDENSSTDISGLLSFLRHLQRSFETAVVLVHHTSKKSRSRPGQALRGSSDFHAWTDSSLFLSQNNGNLILTPEHRSARASGPFTIELRTSTGGANPHLEVCASAHNNEPYVHPLHQEVLSLLSTSNGPLSRTAIRAALKVQNQRLGEALIFLERNRSIRRIDRGWVCLQNNTTAAAQDSKTALPEQLSIPF